MPRNLIAATSLAAVVALAALPAEATVILNVGGVTITDNGPFDANPLLGQITNVGFPSGFTVTVNTGTTTSRPSIDISNADITSTAAATLVVSFTETNLTSAGAKNWLTQFTGSWSGGPGSVELQTYVDMSNTPFGMGTPLADLTSSSALFALSSSNVAGSGLFSVTEVLTINAGAANEHFSLDGLVADAPEPASLGLLGAGLAALGLLRRRKAGGTTTQAGTESRPRTSAVRSDRLNCWR